MMTHTGSVQRVESKYRSFPFAFTYPEDGKTGLVPQLPEINAWFEENGLKFNRDYVNFDVRMRRRGIGETLFYCIAFKDHDKALMFKIAWA